MSTYNVPLIIRGEVIEGDDREYSGRRGKVTFTAPDPARYVGQLGLSRPSAMADLLTLTTGDVIDYLEELGHRLALRQNPYLLSALEMSCQTSGLGRDILTFMYENLGAAFDRAQCQETAEKGVGIPYLDGWVEAESQSGARIGIRAFGTRTVHIMAGNAPMASAIAILRNAISRGDAIFKAPSNDPLTAAAIVRTMIDMAPDHPLTRHASVAYWKGGSADVEDALYQPRNIEKIVVFGGMASVKHVTKYIQPGIELVTFDPKLSSSIVGAAALADEEGLHDVARRIAADGGHMNQEGCVNARVVYVETGTHEEGLRRANRLGELTQAAMAALPSHISGPATAVDESLQDEVRSLRRMSDMHRIFGPAGQEGAVIVSQETEPVDFADQLANRIINIVPVDDLEYPLMAVNAYTQTVGVYPDALKRQIRDQLAMQGGQRIVTLGYAVPPVLSLFSPQDGIEPLRRMSKWIVDESYDSTSTAMFAAPAK